MSEQIWRNEYGFIIDKNDNTICTLPGFDIDDEHNDIARIIENAPEMRAALVEMAKYYQSDIKNIFPEIAELIERVGRKSYEEVLKS